MVAPGGGVAGAVVPVPGVPAAGAAVLLVSGVAALARLSPRSLTALRPRPLTGGARSRLRSLELAL
ncbi:hypothetical protein HRbin41_01602 [bacterium HR41]|nr:hypothetical protein HRbin41_01602 [bacterium HR41]